MLTGLQAARLRGLIARHARCQWNLAATLGDAGEPRRQRIVDDAEAAQRAVFAGLRNLTEKAGEVPAYGAPQVRTPAQKDRLGQDLEQLIYRMQDTAEHMECLGAIDVFVILDAAAHKLRELT